MTLTPTERPGVDELRSDVLAQLAELRRQRARRRARFLPGLPPLRSVGLATALVAVSAALVVAFSALSPRADDEAVAPAPRSSPPAPSPTVAATATALATFVWVPTRGATGYEFRLLRGGAPVYSARTRQPRLTLPKRWSAAGRARRLEPGVYFWDVRPLFGARRGAIVVRARLTVSG